MKPFWRRSGGDRVRVWIGPCFRATGIVTYRDEFGTVYIESDPNSPTLPNRSLEIGAWRLVGRRR